MAIQDRSYEAAERDFWATRTTNIPTNASFNEVKRMGILFELEDATIPGNITINELEKRFLTNTLKTLFNKAAISNRIPDLWLQITAAAGISIDKKPWQQAKFEYMMFYY